ncbi:Nicotinamidase-related amidase [Paenibacillus sp. 1_12]|uniref:cysteine hydrolase family protein n=1 Tax=Paenibacillus sp. 1_12 TaxID=1566278 RepID=UPI0008E77538|nr:isochorismatase family cysteine hydrolase [Paenibacillus sp. 1_12]SFL22221.1 Nicotinamidase-related amidase [Paenibacillus sp. 1_12]
MDTYTKPNFNKCAVITIDTQNDFSLPGAVAEIKGTSEVIPQMVNILATCRQQQIPIIHMIRLYKEGGSNVDICRRELIESGVAIVRPGSKGADLVSLIKPMDAHELNDQALLNGEIQFIGSSEWVIYKPRWGAFYQTKLEQLLMENDIDTLIFIGCNFPNCPRTSMYEASERDFKVVMVEDAISGTYDKGAEEMRNIGIKVYTTESLIQELEHRNDKGLNSV